MLIFCHIATKVLGFSYVLFGTDMTLSYVSQENAKLIFTQSKVEELEGFNGVQQPAAAAASRTCRV